MKRNLTKGECVNHLRPPLQHLLEERVASVETKVDDIQSTLNDHIRSTTKWHDSVRDTVHTAISEEMRSIRDDIAWLVEVRKRLTLGQKLFVGVVGVGGFVDVTLQTIQLFRHN